MSITINAASKTWPRLYRGVPQTDAEKRDFHLSIWKRLYEDKIVLAPGKYEVAIMSHIYGIPERSTIIPIHSLKEHRGAKVREVRFSPGSTEKPLLESHNIESKFG